MSTVSFEKEDGVGRIVFENPEKRNALTLEMKLEIIELLEASRNDEAVSVIILESGGTRAFCSGGDLQEIPENDFRLKEFFDSWEQLFETLRTVELPVIAKVDGWTLGGGFDMLLHIDIVICDEEAMLGQPEIGVGVLNPFSASMLPELIGLRKSMELMLTGEPISGCEAERIGLVTRSVPSDELADEVMEMAEKLQQYSPRVLALTKKSLYDSAQMEPISAYHHLKERSLKHARDDPDYMTGIEAQLSGSEPEWP